ncbi:MAG: hypothetical protein PF485_09810 [Bacteroidales bacterium]|nr:hypothetical protein [Bacteroidales bacterium]
MKIKNLIIASLVFIMSLPVLAQEDDVKLDTIYMLGRRKLVVDVKNISSATVRYSEPGSDETITVKRKQIQKVVFSNGRKEVFNKPVLMMVEEGDWKTVIITNQKNDVEGLYELGFVEASSSAGSRSAKSAKKSAMIRLQKKAAGLGGMIVLVTKEESIGGFGEAPTYEVKGIAYGFEPPKKDKETN